MSCRELRGIFRVSGTWASTTVLSITSTDRLPATIGPRLSRKLGFEVETGWGRRKIQSAHTWSSLTNNLIRLTLAIGTLKSYYGNQETWVFNWECNRFGAVEFRVIIDVSDHGHHGHMRGVINAYAAYVGKPEE